MTDQRQRPIGPADEELEDRSEMSLVGSETTADGEPAPGPMDSPLVRWGLIAGLTLLGAYGFVSGAVGPLLTIAVLVPVVLAMGFSALDRPAASRVMRVVAVLGLVLWLAVTGGFAMVLVVATVVIMIFLHELGHYMAARRAGMKVTEFFLGFGTPLWSFKRGETEFGIKAIPAGAYVKIIGMNNLEEVDTADEARTYRQAPFHSRLSVAVAGSAMHFALALALLFIQFTAFGRVDDSRWTIGELTDGGAAQQAGLHTGDQVVTFDGAPVGTFDEFRDQIRDASGQVVVEVNRDGQDLAIPVELIRRGKIIGTVGTDIDVLEGPGGLFVGPMVDNSRGERAGLETGQKILEVNGESVQTLDDLTEAVNRSTGGDVSMNVATSTRSGATRVTVNLGSAVATTDPTAFLGVGGENGLDRESVPSAVASSITEFGNGVGASVVGIATVFSPPRLVSFFTDTVTGTTADVTDKPTPAEDVAVSSDAGRPTSIIGAVAYGADMTAQNISNLIGFLIALNIFIGVFNLIPLLPFDGGHVAIAVYEKIREMASRSGKRYISDVTRMIPVAYGVVMVLAAVGILAMYLDLTMGVSA